MHTTLRRGLRRALAASGAFVVLFAAGLARAEPISPPYDLYEAGPADAELLSEGFPPSWAILHREVDQGRLWLLLARPDGAPAPDLPGWGSPRYLGRVREGERTVYVAPPAPGVVRTRTGWAATETPRGGSIRVTREHPARLAVEDPHGFQILERSGPAPTPRPPGPPEAIRSRIERVRETEAGGPVARTAQDVLDLIGQVSLAGLESHVRYLSETPSGLARRRYWQTEFTEGEAKLYIATGLENALGTSNISAHPFDVLDESGTPVEVENIVGRLPSARPNAPAVFVTAHYDAIGTRSERDDLCNQPGGRDPNVDCDCSASIGEILADPGCAWQWEYDPSPGADDNATGVAAMLEMARLLAGTAFDFDVYFVAFQAEELGLLGSAAFADSVSRSGQELLFVLNLDMIGYNAVRNEIDAIANETSEWLADWVVETGELFVPSLPVEKVVDTFGRSDHASFWSIGVDGVFLFEDINVANPNYHTLLDTWDNTFIRTNSELQFQLATQLATATIARFALHESDPDLAIPAGELETRSLFGSSAAVGGGVSLLARVHNFGSSSLSFLDTTTDTLTARVTFYDGDPAAGAPALGEVTRREYFGSGDVVSFETIWTPPAGSEGFHEIHAVVEGLDPGYEIRETSSDNNESTARLFVEAPASAGPRVLTHYVYPNPVEGGTDDLGLYFELTKDAQIEIPVWDLGGREVGVFRATGSFVSDGNQAGDNRITGSQFRWSAGELESGVYLYLIRVLDGTGAIVDHRRGKFAIVR